MNNKIENEGNNEKMEELIENISSDSEESNIESSQQKTINGLSMNINVMVDE